MSGKGLQKNAQAPTGLTLRRNNWEEQQKQKFIAVCQDPSKSYRDVLNYIKNEIELSKRMSDFNHKILCFKDDGVFQLNKAITKVYGVAEGKGDDKPSGGGEENLQMIDVILADGTRYKVPYGQILLPDAGEGAHIDIAYDPKTNNLHVKGSCEFQFNSMIDEIIDLTIQYLNTESIYKDQAIELDTNYNPKILKLDNIDKEFMVLSETTETQLKGLHARIRKPEECLRKGIPLKTGILFEGPYGTGKTLLAFKIAKEAIGNGWSFVYLKDPTLLARTLKLAKTLDNCGYGVIVFLEDVDQVTRGNRDASMQDILNTLDGGDTKQMNVIALFTTNHLELIEPTFLRGKRIGSIVSLGALDAPTTMKFLEYTFPDGGSEYKLDRTGLADFCNKVAEFGIVPAFMAEIVEKVKADTIFNEDGVIHARDLDAALEGYLRQVGLAAKKDMSKSAKDYLWEAVGTNIAEALVSSKLIGQVNEIHEATT